MSEPVSIAGNQGSIPVAQQQSKNNQPISTKTGSAFNRPVNTTDAVPQRGLRARIKNFLPKPLYKFVVSVASLNTKKQMQLGEAIARLKLENTTAWQILGNAGSSASSQDKLKMQLSCQESQLKLDCMEGRGDSPVTAHRFKVVKLLKECIESPDNEDLIKDYKSVSNDLKTADNHESNLKLELKKHELKIPALEHTIEQGKNILVRHGLEGNLLQDPEELTQEQQEIEDIAVKNSENALKELKDLKQQINSLKEEIIRSEKMFIDEETAMKAYFLYEASSKS